MMSWGYEKPQSGSEGWVSRDMIREVWVKLQRIMSDVMEINLRGWGNHGAILPTWEKWKE